MDCREAIAKRLLQIQQRYNFARAGGNFVKSHAALIAFGEFAALARLADQIGLPIPQAVTPELIGAPPKRVYFVRASSSGATKIGVSINPRRRFQAGQTWRDDKLQFVGDLEATPLVERALHRLFHEHKTRDKQDLRKGEWFNLPPMTRKQVLKLIADVRTYVEESQ